MDARIIAGMADITHMLRRHATGIPDLDAQHRDLLDLVQELAVAWDERRHLDLIRLDDRHARDEERLALRHGIPFADHADRHAAHRAAMLALRPQSGLGPDRLGPLLIGWITCHIGVLDRDLAMAVRSGHPDRLAMPCMAGPE